VAPSALSEMVHDGEAYVVVAMDRTDDGAMLGHGGPRNTCTWALEDGPARQQSPRRVERRLQEPLPGAMQLCIVSADGVNRNHERRAATRRLVRLPMFGRPASFFFSSQSSIFLLKKKLLQCFPAAIVRT